MTGLETEQDQAKAFAVGGSAFLGKPFELDALLELVERQLQTSRKWSSASLSTPPSSSYSSLSSFRARSSISRTFSVFSKSDFAAARNAAFVKRPQLPQISADSGPM